MSKRGPKPRGNVKIKWSPDFAYAVGVITADGCLYGDGRHINITSKDLEMIQNIKKILQISNKIGKKSRGGEQDKKYYVIQFGDIIFFNFLNHIGIYPRKSKTIKSVEIPKQYFFDFLRGLFDGDGSIHSYFDKRWRSSYMFYLSFVSASEIFINWLQKKITKKIGANGHITHMKGKSYFQLKYAKKESIVLIREMYKQEKTVYLSRKKLKIDRILDTMLENVNSYQAKKDRYY